MKIQVVPSFQNSHSVVLNILFKLRKDGEKNTFFFIFLSRLYFPVLSKFKEEKIIQ